jgi:hypothetical protein
MILSRTISPPAEYLSCQNKVETILAGLMYYRKKFEDTKGVIRSCKSKDRRYNGQKKNEIMR